jgi:Eukaryotic aspartyl protease
MMSIPIDLNSRFGMAYSGPIFVGLTQPANVIYDTGSAWLSVTSAKCDSTCNSNAYNMSDSQNGFIFGQDF